MGKTVRGLPGDGMNQDFIVQYFHRYGAGCEGDRIGVDNLAYVRVLSRRYIHHDRTYGQGGVENDLRDVDVGLGNFLPKPAEIPEIAEEFELQRDRLVIDNVEPGGDPHNQCATQYTQGHQKRHIVAG